MNDFLDIILVMLILITVFGGFGFLVTYNYSKAACEDYSEVTNVETTFNYPGGCFVKVNEDKWVHINEYSYHYVAKEGLKD